MDGAVGKAGRAGERTRDGHISRIVMIFCAWKLLLVLIAVASPGAGYDTSTEILLRRHSHTPESWREYVVIRLTRWDGLYFASASERGLVFEQQWAFSPFLARVASLLAGVLFSADDGERPDVATYALVGILIAHLSHVIAVVLLYQLTYDILPARHDRKRPIAFTTACLHILSPAGLFLSAPYAESAFAMAHFAGLLCYVRARQNPTAITTVVWTLASGFSIGISTMLRSNGLFGGLIFAWDAVACTPNLPRMIQSHDWNGLSRLLATVLAGILIAIGYILPQVVAYLHYCTGGHDRSWCHQSPPSIYSFVQSHYWGVGFLNYWTLSNLPLFALAVPMLLVLFGTGYVTLSKGRIQTVMNAITTTPTPDTSHERHLFQHTLQRFALPQIILALLALTTFHVQIINRISSGYPTWYILIAIAIHAATVEPAAISETNRAGKAQVGDVSSSSSSASEARNSVDVFAVLQKFAQGLVRLSVVYAIVQGGLYASFLPPA